MEREGETVQLCYFLGTFSIINTDLVRTRSLSGDESPVLMRHNIISDILVKVKDKV